MSISLSHPSQKQSLLAIVGVVVAVVLLLLIASMYGRFLKTTVTGPGAQQYTKSGELKTGSLQPGTYALEFNGYDPDNSLRAVTQASTAFEITETAIGEVTDTVVTDGEAAITPMPTLIPSSTPTPVNVTALNCSTPNNTLTYDAVPGSQVELRATLVRKDNNQPVSNASIRWFDPASNNDGASGIIAHRSLTNNQGVAITSITAPINAEYIIAEYSLADSVVGASGDALRCRMTIGPASP